LPADNRKIDVHKLVYLSLTVQIQIVDLSPGLVFITCTGFTDKLRGFTIKWNKYRTWSHYVELNVIILIFANYLQVSRCRFIICDQTMHKLGVYRLCYILSANFSTQYKNQIKSNQIHKIFVHPNRWICRLKTK